jgi:hypothetical protein
MNLRCGRLIVAILFWEAAATGQMLIEPSLLNKDLQRFDATERSTLTCEVMPMQPRIDFGFRFQSGYVMRVPMKQYFGAGHRWGVIIRITPEAKGAKPSYLVSKFSLPNVPHTNISLEVGGSYLLGVGRYAIDWMLVDDQVRTCRKRWSVDVRLKGSDGGVTVRMPPATVWDYSFRNRPPVAKPGTARLTVLVHAAPLSLRSTRLRAYDRALLLGSLATLLESVPAASVKLSVFSLDQQRELFAADKFEVSEISKVAEAMDALELGLVDIKVLQNRKGHVDLLADLLNAELEAAEPADAVIFMGPASRFADKMPQSALRIEGKAPPFFYFEYRSRFRRGQEYPDSIQFAVRRVKGKVLNIYSPQDFAKAINQVERQLGER